MRIEQPEKPWKGDRAFNEILFRITCLVVLCGFSVGAIIRDVDLLGKVCGVVASLVLTGMAGLYLFSRRTESAAKDEPGSQ
jgi:uncharacterized membrane protein YuzA (DUF378 family)